MKKELLKEQMQWVDKWTLNQVALVDEKNWAIEPSTKTSINWQIGHLIVSKYFHAILCILDKGDQIVLDLEMDIPFKDFHTHYFVGSDPMSDWPNRPDKSQLLDYWNKVMNASYKVIDGLQEEKLTDPPEMPNPVAKTKFKALAFSFKHQMYHNGQIAMIKRMKIDS